MELSTLENPSLAFFRSGATVFAVKREYQIVFHTIAPAMGWVEINGKRYHDAVCGVVRSGRTLHKIHVPQRVLDEAKHYSICAAHFVERAPYFPTPGPTFRVEYDFRPVDESDGLQIAMIADSHSHTDAPSRAAAHFGDALDLLVLCGDIGNTAHDEKNSFTVYRLAENLTKGSRPVVFARGNHDTRGAFAEYLPEYMGSDEGRTYFTFRLGSLWGVVLDCGEDKSDDHAEYGPIADFETFRSVETEFLKDVIARKDEEYAAPGITRRIAICHIPFTQHTASDFAGAEYRSWIESLNEMGIDVMLTGHNHIIATIPPHGTLGDVKTGAKFPVIIGSKSCDHPTLRNQPPVPDGKKEFTCTAIDWQENDAEIKFVNSLQEIVAATSLSAIAAAEE